MNDSRAYEILIFTFGPVQSFISTARRTQDLAVASRILSLLAEAALKRVEGEKDIRIVYPMKSSARWPQSLPNQIVVCTPKDKATLVAGFMKGAVEEHWKGMASSVKEWFNGQVKPNPYMAGKPAWGEFGDTQIDEWLEVYWASASWDGEDATYSSAYRNASLGLRARKDLRHYPIQSQPGEKCTLCGTHSALGTEEVVWRHVRESKEVRASELRPGERLSAVSLVKRFGANPKVNIPELRIERFPSTSSIASASFRAIILEQWDAKVVLKSDKGEEEIQIGTLAFAFLDALKSLKLQPFPQIEPGKYWQKLAGGHRGKERLLKYDGDYFYPEFFTEKQVAEERGIKINELTEEEKEIIHNIGSRNGALGRLLGGVKALAERTPLRAPFPNPYFAVLTLDGDRMGKLLGEAGSLEEHEKISQALSLAAENMQSVVDADTPGQMIYCSGDDALALLPVDYALPIAHKLQKIFSDHLRDKGFPNRTASIGLAITHHRRPLELGLRHARLALESAKGKYERGALAIEMLKRSGEPRETGLHWLPDDFPDPIDEVRRRVALGELSGKFAYEVYEEASALANLYAAHELEFRRLLMRHYNRYKWDNPSEREDLAKRLTRLTDFIPENAASSAIEGVAEWLLVARFLAQGEQP